MVVPRLSCHLDGHEDAKQTEYCAGHLVPEKLLQVVCDTCHTESYPNGICVERACVGIVAFTRLHGRLVEVQHDCEAGHEEEEEDDTELLLAFALILLVVLEELPQQTDEAEQEWQAIEDVVTFVLAEFAWQLALISQSHIVDEGNAANPVAVFPFAISLQVVLPSCKVPHEVAPIHEVDLIAEEEAEVLELGRCLDLNHLATPFV